MRNFAFAAVVMVLTGHALAEPALVLSSYDYTVSASKTGGGPDRSETFSDTLSYPWFKRASTGSTDDDNFATAYVNFGFAPHRAAGQQFLDGHVRSFPGSTHASTLGRLSFTVTEPAPYELNYDFLVGGFGGTADGALSIKEDGATVFEVTSLAPDRTSTGTFLPGHAYELIGQARWDSLDALRNSESFFANIQFDLTVPEPSSAALLFVGCLALLRRRARR